MSTQMQVEGFFDKATNTISYLVVDAVSQTAAIIDSVLDYDPKSGRTRHDSAQRIVDAVRQQNLTVAWILETHVHADHLSAAPWLREQVGGRLGIGEHILTVQNVFGKLFNAGPDFPRDGSQFDALFKDGDTFGIGGLQVQVMHTPGHTPACLSYVISDGAEAAAFVGDTLFMPDYGTARCDFPGGDAHVLYRSIRRLLQLPAQTKLYLCHDYMPGGRAPVWQTTVEAQREQNIHVHDGVSEADFVAMRTARDATLDMPVLMLPSVQVNMRAGALPPTESNGVAYLKIPLNAI